MIAIYKRDLKGFFTGMMGYVLLAFFLAVGGLCMMIPGTLSDVGGLVMVIAVLLYQRIRSRRVATIAS